MLYGENHWTIDVCIFKKEVGILIKVLKIGMLSSNCFYGPYSNRRFHRREQGYFTELYMRVYCVCIKATVFLIIRLDRPTRVLGPPEEVKRKRGGILRIGTWSGREG